MDDHTNLRPLPWIFGEGFRVATDPVAVRLRVRLTLALVGVLLLLGAVGSLVGVTEARPSFDPAADRPPASVEILADRPHPLLTTTGAR